MVLWVSKFQVQRKGWQCRQAKARAVVGPVVVIFKCWENWSQEMLPISSNSTWTFQLTTQSSDLHQTQQEQSHAHWWRRSLRMPMECTQTSNQMPFKISPMWIMYWRGNDVFESLRKFTLSRENNMIHISRHNKANYLQWGDDFFREEDSPRTHDGFSYQ